jgi:NAD(P)-dependent dehydrogenase (short-subunit alcohol dehydrogenase family)
MDVAGKTVFITGAAWGIGLSIARAFAARGAKIMLADINEARLKLAEKELSDSGADVGSVICNVADDKAVRAAADATLARFGKVHVVVNNAGVGTGGRAGETDLDDWRWIVDINLMGVVYGVEIFTPLIKSHGEGGYIINTASMAGHVASGGMAPYHATKFAVVGYSEALKADLATDNIGVSVLCPAWVQTEIYKSFINSPTRQGEKAEELEGPDFEAMKDIVQSGIAPDLVGEWTVDSVEADRFYIFTHPSMAAYIDARHQQIKADYAACAADPRLAAEPESKPLPG